MDLAHRELARKTVLEVGSGRGDTTRQLVALLSRYPGTRLIATDVSDRFFAELRGAFQGQTPTVRFLRTDACVLEGISDNSVDYVVCNYTLCAVDAQAGRTALALQRFWQVLRPGGELFIEEELPTSTAHTPMQEVWAEKWRILKAATVLAEEMPYSEFVPDDLAALCRLTGFRNVQWELDTTVYDNPAVLDFFQQRLERLLPKLPNDHLRVGFAMQAAQLRARAVRVGGMEVPFYRLSARR